MRVFPLQFFPSFHDVYASVAVVSNRAFVDDSRTRQLAYKEALPFIVIKCHIFFMGVGSLFRYAKAGTDTDKLLSRRPEPIKTFPSTTDDWLNNSNRCRISTCDTSWHCMTPPFYDSTSLSLSLVVFPIQSHCVVANDDDDDDNINNNNHDNGNLSNACPLINCPRRLTIHSVKNEVVSPTVTRHANPST